MDLISGMFTGDTKFNKSTTENGAIGYKTSGKALLDLNFSVPNFRNEEPYDIVDRWNRAWLEDKNLALKFLFFARDIREGLGERRFFRVIMSYMAKNHPEEIKHLIERIPAYGRWDDLIDLYSNLTFYFPNDDDNEIKKLIIDIIRKQLTSDTMAIIDREEELKKGHDVKPFYGISLLAKWLPSINTSSKEARKIAKKLCDALKMTPARYRKTLSMLRKHLNIVETMVHGKWDEIEYESVPSKANLKYKNAFLKHDRSRRLEFLESLKSGDAKINSGTLFPYEVIHAYKKRIDPYFGSMIGYDLESKKMADPTLEGLWKCFPNYIQGNFKPIVVLDGSFSMSRTIKGVTLSTIAESIAIYFAEKMKGEFANKFITFSRQPELVELGDGLLIEKLLTAVKYTEIGNTNIEAVFDLLLDAAISGNYKQSNMPDSILIISDMEFDQSKITDSNGNKVNKSLFKIIEDKYTNAGYKLPKLIFWNVGSITNTIPVHPHSDLDICLVSGFSLNIIKMVMSGELDPWEILMEQLRGMRYYYIHSKDSEASDEVRFPTHYL
jgi:hypothetical protein